MEVKKLAKTTTITMRVDGDLKQQAELVCEDIGLTPSAAYTLFLKAIVRTRSIPFKLEASNSFLSDSNSNYLLESIKKMDDINDNEYFN